MSETIQPLVTIAIPTYNRANSYLKQSLESAIDQSYQNVEIIVSDNCSTDNTEDVVKSFNDPRIRYFRQSVNIGMLNNENFCLEKAKGDYFLLLCDDDMIDHDLVEVCMKAANYNTSIGVILTGIRVINKDSKVLYETTNKVGGLSTTDFFLGWFDWKIPLYLCSTLFNTKRLKEIGGFKSKKNLFEDAVALFKLAAKFGRVDVRDVKASFRIHPKNIGSVASVGDWCEDGLYLLDIMCNLELQNRDLIRRKGLVFFCRRNYDRSSLIKSPIKRFYAYLMVYKKFEYSYSPISYICSRNIFYKNSNRLISFVKRKIKKALL